MQRSWGARLGSESPVTVYDNVLEPGFNAAKDIGGEVVDGVVDTYNDVKGKAEDVVGFLNPF